MAEQQLTDWWGNPALDYGEWEDLLRKYADNYFVTVTNHPFGKRYVLAIYNEDEFDEANAWADEFIDFMHAKGIRAFGAGVQWGDSINERKMMSIF
jgi:hypothetical protein